MEDSVVKLLETGSEEDVLRLLQEFNLKFESQFGPVGLGKDAFKRVWKLIIALLFESKNDSVLLICLKTLRILSRDKVAFNEVVDTEHVKLTVRLAGLVTEEEAVEQINLEVNYEVVMEAQKCLSNMIYNSTAVQRMCCTNSCMPGLMCRLRMFREVELPMKVKSFDMRLLFLITAFCADVRPCLRTDYHCLTYLIEILDHFLETEREKMLNLPSRLRLRATVTFAKEYCDLIIDILKVLYNLVLHFDRCTPDEEEESHCIRLMTILRSFLLAAGPSSHSTEELHSNTVNLLLVMPPKLYEELLQPMPALEPSSAAGFCGAIGGSAPEPDYIIEYDGKDMSAIAKLLDFLHKRLRNQTIALNESITPILNLMVELTQSHRIIRKFIRLKVLPPLRDVMKRPEEGESIRNKLCLLMTSPVHDVKQLSANFLFILCKERVDRLIKYTGYGNAAGLLATRGLMMGRQCNVSDYSSDSEESDTEEYEKLKDKVNPVTGRYEPIRPSPLDGMTEEQKEYEAMKLVNALDKMSRANIIQPCRMGEDGRPQPVSHVMELLENQTGGTPPPPPPQQEEDRDVDQS